MSRDPMSEPLDCEPIWEPGMFQIVRWNFNNPKPVLSKRELDAVNAGLAAMRAERAKVEPR